MSILIIIESPGKISKIKQYLGDNYVVCASLGHIREIADQGEHNLGIDVQNNFKPHYVISKSKQKVVNQLKSYHKKCTDVIICTDKDFEGESIAWHISQVLNLKNPKRMVFNHSSGIFSST